MYTALSGPLTRLNLSQSPSVNAQPKAEAETDCPQESFSQASPLLDKAKTFLGLALLGRRIPTTYPVTSPQKLENLREKIQPGDVILTTDMAYPNWARMEYWAVKSQYTHAALVGSDGLIYESADHGVSQVKLEDMLNGRFKVAVVRVGLDGEQAAKATEFCQANLGKKYDSAFDTESDSEFYCSELVAKALEHGSEKVHIPRTPIAGREVISPDIFRELSFGSIIHDDGSAYWANKLSYAPVIGSALMGAGAGAALLGVAAAPLALGAFTGYAVSSTIGNALQTGTPFPFLDEVKKNFLDSPDGKDSGH